MAQHASEHLYTTLVEGAVLLDDLEPLRHAEFAQLLRRDGRARHSLDPFEGRKYLLRAALVDVEEREQGAVWFLPIEKRIMLADNTKAFSLSPTVQEMFLPDLHCPIDPELDLALRELDIKGLEKLAGKYLSEDQIQALLKRRDKILELCSKDNC